MTLPKIPKYPEVRVPLVGHDGNAFSIIGRARRAMERAGFEQRMIDEFVTEATSGDYEHLLSTAMRWFRTN